MIPIADMKTDFWHIIINTLTIFRFLYLIFLPLTIFYFQIGQENRMCSNNFMHSFVIKTETKVKSWINNI